MLYILYNPFWFPRFIVCSNNEYIGHLLAGMQQTDQVLSVLIDFLLVSVCPSGFMFMFMFMGLDD